MTFTFIFCKLPYQPSGKWKITNDTDYHFQSTWLSLLSCLSYTDIFSALHCIIPILYYYANVMVEIYNFHNSTSRIGVIAEIG